MFIQIIEGKVSDAEGMRRQFDRWQQELAPGAKGHLGATGGVTDDGTLIMMARFETEAAARANSERAEQGAWWNEAVKYFEGEPLFRDCREVETTLAGGSDTAGFVQIMQGRAADRATLKAMEEELMPRMAEMRPDVIGSVRAWDGDLFTEAIYFTSEADARKGETAMNEPGADEPDMERFMSLMTDLRYLDLKDPWLFSA